MAGMEDLEHARGERSFDRMLALSDGVFAFAITLLALDIILPSEVGITSNGALLGALGNETQSFVSFIISFFVVGTYWVEHHRIFRYVKRTDDRLLWINILFLFFIVLVPFATRVLEAFGTLQVAVALYASINAGTGVMAALMWRYASHGGRLTEGLLSTQTMRRMQIRTLIAPAVFALSIPLSFIETTVSFVSWMLSIPFLFLLDRFLLKRSK